MSMAAAAGDPLGDGDCCSLFDNCFCCWRESCSPHIPVVAPGRDYLCVPAAADDRPAWSVLVLVGVAASGDPSHNVRAHRFRVAASGCVIAGAGTTLEPFAAVSPDDDGNGDGEPTTVFSFASAALAAPDRRRVFLVCDRWRDDAAAGDNDELPHRAFHLDLAAAAAASGAGVSRPRSPASTGKHAEEQTGGI